MRLREMLKRPLKRLLYPGLDMHLRCRYRHLPKFFVRGPVHTLDAGCGNGALSFAAYRLGNSVLGVTHDPGEVEKAKVFFSGIPAERLDFQACDLYRLDRLGRQFDQIICSETLEHIRGDADVVRLFYRMLRPGGVLHLCCPFALHPHHRLGRVDNPEDGGHVRDGYTFESFRALLEPAGFQITRQAGIGSPPLVRLELLMQQVRLRFGDAAALPLLAVGWPAVLFDRLDPKTPFSIYVTARKPCGSTKA